MINNKPVLDSRFLTCRMTGNPSIIRSGKGLPTNHPVNGSIPGSVSDIPIYRQLSVKNDERRAFRGACRVSCFVKEPCGLECGARALRPQNREGILAAKILMVLSVSIVFTLGVVHLVYTFWGPNLTPRDPAVQISMSQIAPVITKETTMWRCWVGFNASHSVGLILFGLVFGFLALAHTQLLFQSPFLLVVGLAMLCGLVVLSKVYFFRLPLTGISISLACYVASIVLWRALTMRP